MEEIVWIGLPIVLGLAAVIIGSLFRDSYYTAPEHKRKRAIAALHSRDLRE